MTYKIIQIGHDRLNQYYSIPISFEIHSIYNVIEINNRIELIEQSIEKPYIKDYDQIEREPIADGSTVFLVLNENDIPIGGAIVSMIPDCTIVDVRIAPAYRRAGIGRILFEHVVQWCRQQEQTINGMNIETQNNNVSACRFYAAMGAKLISIDRHAYENDERVKDEIRFNWFINFLCQ